MEKTLQEKNQQIVIINNGKATTTSLKVAEYFGKQHKNVIAVINKLREDLDVSDRLNFQPVEYCDSKGEYRAMYEIDRDGFTLLAMGFTGKTALAFKLSYIDAFNKAEKMLTSAPSLPADPIMAQLAILQSVRESQIALESSHHVLSIGISETRNDVNHLKQNMRVENWQQCNIQKAVHSKSAGFKELYPHAIYGDIIRKIWRFFKSKFAIPRYQELPAMRYDEAMRTLHSLAMHNLAGL